MTTAQAAALHRHLLLMSISGPNDSYAGRGGCNLCSVPARRGGCNVRPPSAVTRLPPSFVSKNACPRRTGARAPELASSSLTIRDAHRASQQSEKDERRALKGL